MSIEGFAVLLGFSKIRRAGMGASPAESVQPVGET